MTKADLINLIAEKSNITRVKAETVVNTIFDSMVEALMRNDRIEIRGFGSFVNRDYGAYKGSAANHHFIIENVIDTLKGRTIITTNALEGLKVVDIIERIYSQRTLSKLKNNLIAQS